MKIWSLVYKLSFITYLLLIYALPYISANTLADIVLIVFILSVVFQIGYIFIFRKKDNVSFGHAVSLQFLCISIIVDILIIISYARMFVCGYTPSDFFGNSMGVTYYGIEAIRQNDWADVVFVPMLVICTLYQVIFFLVRNKKKDSKHT